MDITFSIVIPALNEEHFLPNLLIALKNQTFKEFEVILVDADSKDKTVEIGESFSKHFPVRILRTQLKNVSASRNSGASKSRGTYLCFIDADNSIPENFLEICNKYVSKKGYDVLLPSLLPEDKKNPNLFMFKIATFFVYIMSFTSRPFSTGSTIIVSKKYFEKIKGFDTNISIAEDHDFVRRLQKTHAKIKLMLDTYVIFSTRRFDQNRILTYAKYVYSSLYLILFTKIKKNMYNYEMGGDKFP